MITQSELKRIWHYDLNTGLFTCLIPTGRRCRIGDIPSGSDGAGYLRIGIKNKRYRVHRLAWLYMTGNFPKNHIDHFNGIRNDNRWSNLRDVSAMVNCQNLRNLRKTNTSGYEGVFLNKVSGNWYAEIKVNNKKIRLGTFKNLHEAGAYRLQKKRELHEGCTV